MFFKIFAAWVVLINIIAVFLTLYDKSAARKGKRRVPEKTLFLIALIGGSTAMFFTMVGIRHKTRHMRFMIGIPIIIILQFIVLSVIYSAL